MTGELALMVPKKSKDEHKKKFYENLFCKEQRSKLQYDQSVLDLDYEKKMVLFVYNGRDFVDTSKEFCSDNFDSAVIHLPNKFCIRWLSDYKLKVFEDFVMKKGINIKDIFPDVATEEDST
jgi:hypothetical protein